jgi:hypothetical protein
VARDELGHWAVYVLGLSLHVSAVRCVVGGERKYIFIRGFHKKADALIAAQQLRTTIRLLTRLPRPGASMRTLAAACFKVVRSRRQQGDGIKRVR